jgi:FkbM family methyltransferase
MKFNNALEIGASDAEGSFVLKHYSNFERATLIEPNIILFRDLMEKTSNLKNITIKNCAISDYSGREKLYHIGRSSFLKNSDSFINLMSKSPWQGSLPEYYLSRFSLPVEVVNIKSFNHHDFDFISVACNGSELSIIKNLITKPKFLRCTFHFQNAQQCQYSQSILSLLKHYNYEVINSIENETKVFADIIFKKI